MNFFYDHIVLIHYIHSEIESMDIASQDKQRAIEIIEETIHHRILHRILDRLSTQHHQEFLHKFHQSPHDEEILRYLKKTIPDIEFHIKEAAEEVKFDLLKAIRDSQE